MATFGKIHGSVREGEGEEALYRQEGVFLDVIGTKILMNCYIFNQLVYSPYGFIVLEISAQTAESRWELGFVHIISLLTFNNSIVLSLTLFLRETIIRNASKRAVLTENHTHSMVSKI